MKGLGIVLTSLVSTLAFGQWEQGWNRTSATGADAIGMAVGASAAGQVYVAGMADSGQKLRFWTYNAYGKEGKSVELPNPLGYEPLKLVVIPQGGFVVLARAQSNSLVVRVDASMKVVWTKSDVALWNDILLAPSGNLYVGGRVWGPFGSWDTYLGCLLPTGVQAWVSRWGSPQLGDEAVVALAQTDQGDVYGVAESEFRENSDILAMMWKPTGALAWARRHDFINEWPLNLVVRDGVITVGAAGESNLAIALRLDLEGRLLYAVADPGPNLVTSVFPVAAFPLDGNRLGVVSSMPEASGDQLRMPVLSLWDANANFLGRVAAPPDDETRVHQAFQNAAGLFTVDQKLGTPYQFHAQWFGASGSLMGAFSAGPYAEDCMLKGGALGQDGVVYMTGFTRSRGMIVQKAVPTPRLVSVSAARSVKGGLGMKVTVKLSAPAAGLGVKIALKVTGMGVGTYPASVTIPAGGTSIQATVGTVPVPADKVLTLTATAGAISKTITFKVLKPNLVSFAAVPLTSVSGNPYQFQFGLDGPAPAAYSVQLSIPSGLGSSGPVMFTKNTTTLTIPRIAPTVLYSSLFACTATLGTVVRKANFQVLAAEMSLIKGPYTASLMKPFTVTVDFTGTVPAGQSLVLYDNKYPAAFVTKTVPLPSGVKSVAVTLQALDKVALHSVYAQYRGKTKVGPLINFK